MLPNVYDMYGEPHSAYFVYRCFDGEGQLLYIGRTDNLERRLSNHRSDPLSSEWFPLVARVRARMYATKDAARIGERAAIRTERPPHNRQHNMSRPVRATSRRGFVADADQVRRLLLAQRRNQAWLAAASGTSQPHLSHIMTGQRAASVDLADRLAAALRVPVGDIFPALAGVAA